jgi:hypothetical protein
VSRAQTGTEYGFDSSMTTYRSRHAINLIVDQAAPTIVAERTSL